MGRSDPRPQIVGDDPNDIADQLFAPHEHPLILEQGHAIALVRPGHGISFDWNALAQLSA